MTDLTEQILSIINTNTIKLTDWDREFITPNYDGGSILNIPATGAGLLGSPGTNSSPLSPEISSHLPDEVKNVIVILVDALSFQRFSSWLKEEPDLVWNQLVPGGLLAPLTSICPSTTCAAISTFWTGASAAKHGIMGYEMWLKEYGVVANMIEHKPITYRIPGGNLSLAGFDPESFLPVKSVTDQLLKERVEVHAFQHFAIINSGLSRMFMRDAQRHPISTATDMWISIRELLESHTDNRNYIWAYWDKLDSISHFHGPDSERALAELVSFSKAFETHLLDKLGAGLKKDTLVILTADHGQITTDKDDDQYQLKNHPDFIDKLHHLPSGENRLAYLHIKPGQVEGVKEYIQDTWPEQFVTIDPVQAVEGGLFGPGDPHPDIFNRLGDLIVAAKGQAYWWWAAKDNPLIGRHGGLSEDEMLVPFLAARL